MAVSFTPARAHKEIGTATITDYCVNQPITGTYVQGGFTWYPLLVPGGPGTSPDASSVVVDVVFRGTAGYAFDTTISTTTPAGQGPTATATTKIYSAAGMELAAGALPVSTVGVVIVKGKR